MELAHSLRRELRQALRSLRRAPSFSVIALVTLSLGIGATMAIYGVLESVVLRPLPYRDAGRLVAVLHPATVPGNGEGKWGMSAGGYFQFRALSHTLEDLGGYTTSSATLVGGDAAAEQVRVAEVTATVFSTLRARPFLGRLIGAAEDAPGAPPTVVLSHELWRSRFGADREIVGKTIRLSGQPFRVIGVAEPGLTLPMPGPFASTANVAGFGVDVWLPLQLDPNGPFWNSHQYTGIGRLKPGVTVEQAQADLAAITRRLPELVPNAYSEGFMRQYAFRVSVEPLEQAVLGPAVARSLWILFGAVGLVLLIACANVANLFLVRMEARRRETTIRAALGASRSQMALHHLTESLLLTLGAAVLAIPIARWGMPALLAAAPRSIPRLSGVSLRWTAVALGIVLAIAAGVAFGLVPLVRRGDDASTLRDGGRGATGSRRQRAVRGALVVAQVALAVVLLAAAGLLVRSFERLRGVRPGLDPNGVLTFEITLPFDEYHTVEQAVAFHQQLSARLAALPGVTAVGASDKLPLQDYGAGCTSVGREGRPYTGGEKAPCVPTPTFAPGWFAAMGIAVRGRAPDWSDVGQRTQAAVITQALADRLWPGEDPLGKGILPGDRGRGGYYRVAGVIPDLRAAGLDQPPTEALFVPATMLGDPPHRGGELNSLVYAVRTSVDDPTSLVPEIRAVLASLNSQVPMVNPRTMREVVSRSVARTTFIMLLLGTASVMALVLSAVGIYGVISYVVTQQRAEIGIRMALGARESQVGRMVVAQSLRLGALGAMIGVAAALAGTRLLRSLLFDVSPTDPLVLSVVPVVLLALAAAASFAPARRAARVDPVEAMRT
ncbi:MAG TPA: ABC transporter permease [Gemmatimonadaceae bacterium]|nr:ABC transporter permease [Gemmatimonadaceae bacterium]